MGCYHLDGTIYYYSGLSEYKRSKVAKQIDQKHMAMTLQTSLEHPTSLWWDCCFNVV